MTMPTKFDVAIVRWAGRIEELAADLPDLSSTDFSARRVAEKTLSDEVAREFTTPAAPEVTVSAVEIPIAKAAPIRARLYRPEHLLGSAPTQLFLHGGGFVSGTVDELINDRLLTFRARAADIQILSIEYRLAPEHPYPAAVDDVLAVLAALRDNPGFLSVDATRVGVGGASAGASIAASVALRVRADGGFALLHQALEVPALALRPMGESAALYARGYGLDGYEQLGALYLPDPSPPDAYAEPALLTDPMDLRGLPETWIQVAEHDPLRDAALTFAEALRRANVPVTVEVGEGHVHGSPGLTAVFEPARRWQRHLAATLRRAYHPAT
ncbi:alpha/beta hydrolase fold domain-containing protein [Leifsonia sp. ZF2019]|uniref:alpha/beta hydrolase fold domain-containing protein n=1 Tax=Leifsonia sp. ZF2019 TaxID=2781978 RepID=UPI001CBB0B8A|nr:alpha/beta hydrolase fold domain-containing protein [Leifsonia sp. ZF2019]UAJ80674.1 alpha/beta hydrolase fold domain-containing protein [Leifsonia sp. ZF2019]